MVREPLKVRREALRDSFNEIEGVSSVVVIFVCISLLTLHILPSEFLEKFNSLIIFIYMKEFKIATSMDTTNIEEIQEFLDDSIKGEVQCVALPHVTCFAFKSHSLKSCHYQVNSCIWILNILTFTLHQ